MFLVWINPDQDRFADISESVLVWFNQTRTDVGLVEHLPGCGLRDRQFCCPRVLPGCGLRDRQDCCTSEWSWCGLTQTQARLLY